VLVSRGRSVAEAVRSIGVTRFAHYRWREEFGGLETDQVTRLKELEKENERLRKAVSDLTLGKLILREAASGTEGPRSEASEPRPPPRPRRSCPAGGLRLGARRLPGARPESLDPAQGAARTGRRGRADRGHRRARQPVRALRLSPELPVVAPLVRATTGDAMLRDAGWVVNGRRVERRAIVRPRFEDDGEWRRD
jgi:putative transposase